MDYYEARDDLDGVEGGGPEEPSRIQCLFEGAHIFITGASGFMGKVLMEKLLRTCNVAQIYILVRDKKGVKSEDRFQSIFNDKLFEPLKLAKPGEVRKVTAVAGDCSQPGLGLSSEAREALSRTQVVFHAAATLQMDQSLRVAYNTNVCATKFLLEFAKTLPQLKAFIYVSTAYTHAYRDLVEETFYSVVYDEDDIGKLCDQLDDTQLGALTPKLVGRWGNTYALTKACAENLVSKYDGVLPIGVVRPSIVVSVWREPLAGWINNLYGTVGVVTGSALGLLRVWCAGPDTIGDMIPVDVAINTTLAAAWEVACKNTHLKIYNLVSSPTNPITYKILRMAGMAMKKKQPIGSTKGIAAPDLTLTDNKNLFLFYTLWYHVIPAYFIDLYLAAIGKNPKLLFLLYTLCYNVIPVYFIDIYLAAIGKTPRLLKVYTKVYNINKFLMPYCSEEDITFRSENVGRMWESMNESDKRMFYFDLKSMGWEEFWAYGLKGLRVYLLDDPMETVMEGNKHFKKLEMRKFLFDSIIWLIFGSLMYFLFFKRFLY